MVSPQAAVVSLETGQQEMTLPSVDGVTPFGDASTKKKDKEVQPLMKIQTTEPEIKKQRVEQPKKESPYLPLLRQSFGMAAPLCSTISTGMTSGFSGILLPQLDHVNSTITVTPNEASWIAGMAALPMALGCIISGLLMERYGRKLSQQIICVPYVVGWVLLSLAHNIELLYLGRFLTGLCVGLIGPVTTIYIAEMSGPKYRGVFLAVVSFGVAFGILLTHILGTYLSWRLTAAISAVLPFICYCIMSCLPESPNWLAARGRTEAAEKTFRWFRGSSAEEELRLLIIKYDKEREQNKLNKLNQRKWAEFSKNVLDSSFIKPFVIINIFFFVQQFSGVNAVTFYTVTILRDVGLGVDEYYATIAIDTVRVLISILACGLLRRVGRRPLAILSGIGTAISLLGLGFYLRYMKGNTEVDVVWLPMLLFITYICFISVGYVPLPWVMMGEVFPSATRGLGSGSTSSFGFLVFFIVVKTSPGLFLGLGNDGAFFLYGGVATAGIIFLYFFLPETMNRTLQDIEDRYKEEKLKKMNKKKANEIVC